MRNYLALFMAMTIFGCGSGAAKYADEAPLASKMMPIEAGAAMAEATEFNTETYDHIVENAFLEAARKPLSTFSIDVDTASYSNMRRFLQQGQLPPAGAVRIEELVNYFRYDYPPPVGDVPFSCNVELAGCPWNPQHQLARIALKGREIEVDQRPSSNLVFLLDVSGSMRDQNKLPLVKSAMRLLLENLGENDRVAIVVYAGASGLALPSTPADRREIILSTLDNLMAGGSTNGGEGIQLAYNVAVKNFIPGGTNRVILCTDGDFNIGSTSQGELIPLIEEKAASGVYLTVLGFGMGNYKDSTLEKLADKGNGNYGYIDTMNEARKVFLEQMTGTLITIAKDVKIQIDFNPAQVAAYRLIGYENRLLRDEDFQDDTKDAGEIGAGHTVTALYEVVPVGQEIPAGKVEPSKYQVQEKASPATTNSDEVLTVRLRYKQPEGNESRELQFPVTKSDKPFTGASGDFQFAAAVASFGMLLRDSQYKGDASFDAVLEIAGSSRGEDAHGYRGEFLELVRTAKTLKAEH